MLTVQHYCRLFIYFYCFDKSKAISVSIFSIYRSITKLNTVYCCE